MEQEGNGVNPNPNPANQPENQPPAPAAGNLIPPNSPPPHLNCARCDSSNTKFCYFNNYSRAQPRYFCRSCRRYWTHGGTLRNLPNGVGARRVRRPLRVRQAPAAGQGCRALMLPPEPHQQMPEPHQQMMGPAFYGGGSFLQPFPAGQLTGNIGLLQAITLQSLKSPAAGNLVAQQNLIAQPIRAWAPNGNASGSGSNGAGPSFIDEAGPSFSDDPDQWLEDDRQG